MDKKNEIIDKYWPKSVYAPHPLMIFGAMDEWAKVMSIRFAEWVLYEGYSLNTHTPLAFTWSSRFDNSKYSTEYLYNLFLESIKE